MGWQSYIKEFGTYLKLERSLSENSLEAYLHDIQKFSDYLEMAGLSILPAEVKADHIKKFLSYLAKLGIAASSQARILSGIKAFYKYLMLEETIERDPSVNVHTPRIDRKIPDVLSLQEIEDLLAVIDLSTPEGARNRAMIEVLYSSGLRVTELIELKISNLYLDIGFLRIIGKANKERFVPIGREAARYLISYIENIRSNVPVKPNNEDFVFLNRRGTKISRVMVFMIIKEVALLADIKKNISPHTFRHSFATHLILGGANIKAVQEMLGHENITTTEIYKRLDQDILRQTLLEFHPRS
ncbi:site-specific tyrosine recombinase XerD [Microscilla marina]|uniref:Tyrosine recombinase XerC n=1 Tax=Microscilla marina ATCC 23134 TaxID=313606 RepID=A1ZPB9_MICM2|nr:site-specific tyrosine recombinase XerD [Microscilla marina]EAY27658.1 tyrosine recombinase XerD [Microscilla marina ATCC 23134]